MRSSRQQTSFRARRGSGSVVIHRFRSCGDPLACARSFFHRRSSNPPADDFSVRPFHKTALAAVSDLAKTVGHAVALQKNRCQCARLDDNGYGDPSKGCRLGDDVVCAWWQRNNGGRFILQADVILHRFHLPALAGMNRVAGMRVVKNIAVIVGDGFGVNLQVAHFGQAGTVSEGRPDGLGNVWPRSNCTTSQQHQQACKKRRRSPIHSSFIIDRSTLVGATRNV